jgi:hypothetical protein
MRGSIPARPSQKCHTPAGASAGREPSPIEIAVQGKPGRLRIVLLDPSAGYDTTARARPIGGMVLQFRDFPAWIEVLITQAPERTLERGCHPRYYGI